MGARLNKVRNQYSVVVQRWSMQTLIPVQLVNTNGQPKGIMEKIEAHRTGQLHLAFSVMLLYSGPNGIECLLQKRAASKYHSAGKWTNSCCSHPLPGETMQSAVTRRLTEELGYKNETRLHHAGQVTYKLMLEEGMIEHEFDHIYFSFLPSKNQDFNPHPEEITALRWESLLRLSEDIRTSPSKYTKWLPLIVDTLNNHYLLQGKQNRQNKSYAS